MIDSTKNFQKRSLGKLMLTGEYLVLQGAKSLALACNRGQQLSIHYTSNSENIHWTSRESNGNIWFEAEFNKDFTIVKSNDTHRAKFISKLLNEAFKLSPHSTSKSGLKIATKLEFDKDWGLGSSSTLIHNIATWIGVDPFVLLQNTLGGSGYDIAVAEAQSSILYSLKPKIHYDKITFSPSYKNNIFFIYLNKKENSAEAVSKFTSNNIDYTSEAQEVSKISIELLNSDDLLDFERLIHQHNTIISQVLNRKSAQEIFSQYDKGILKYLGAWGGDFMLATGTDSDMDFFRERSFNTILSFDDIIL